MHITPVATSIVALGVLLGGLTTSTDTGTPDTARQYAAIASSSHDNNGNG